MAASLLEELLGLRTNKAPSTPDEATDPTVKRDQHDAAHPLVGASAAPTPPPTNDTLAAQQVEVEQRWLELRRNSEEVSKLQLTLETMVALHRAEAERLQDRYDNARIVSGAPGAYVVHRLGRRFARLWVTSYQPIQIVVPGTGQPVPRMMRPGWNTLDAPEGSRIYTLGTAFDATFCASETPSNPEIDKAVSGYVNVAAATTGIGTDTSIPVVAGHWMLQNNTASALQFEVDAQTSAGSPVIASGAMITADVPIYIALHLLTAAAQPFNGTSGSNIVFRGWN
jgi:hypothetical protein